jgi:hypothetical protein
MAQRIDKYLSNDSKEFDTLDEAETRDFEMELGKELDKYIEEINLKKGGKVFKERAIGFFAYRKKAEVQTITAGTE